MTRSILFVLALFLGKVCFSAKDLKLRSSYKIISYEISLKVMPETKSLEGSNLIRVLALKSLQKIELDLFPQMHISAILFEGKSIAFERDSFTFSFKLPQAIKKGDAQAFQIQFYGTPIEAKKAPWDGGFVWAKDSSGNHWVGLACEGLGASCWLPCKDQWDDEPEKFKMRLAVPSNLTGVSNGRLLGTKIRPDGFKEFEWAVNSPINHYNLSVNVGAYTHLEDVYLSESGNRLSLDYYVLQDNVSKAKTHFQQVKRMLQCNEKNFGPYPFYTDGYKLVETPYWGMEHQSCIAYGNNYQNNKFGFDFIIIHESGHEWFANSITASDKADMWIHESFTTYSEALYVERQYNFARSVQYLLGQKGNIKNELPMIGPKGVNYNRPDNDLYYKGTWILHTMRSMLDKDTLWFNTLKDLNTTFKHQIISSKQLEQYFIKRTGYNFKPFFEQYLYQPELPVLEYYLVEKNELNELHYRLKSKVNALQMPVKVTLTKGVFDYLVVDKKWRVIDLPYSSPEEFKVDEKSTLIGVKRILPEKLK